MEKSKKLKNKQSPLSIIASKFQFIISPLGFGLCIFDTKQVDTNYRGVDFCTSVALLVVFAGICVSTGLTASFFFFFFLGKLPAGPVCGITPQDPSRAGSQKRKQLSDNELLFCDQTSAFPRSEWGCWERVKYLTYTHIVCIIVHIKMLMRSHAEKSNN